MMFLGPSGFRNAPVSKFLLVFFTAISLSVSLAGWKKFVITDAMQIVERGQVFRLISHSVCFVSSAELLFGLLLLFSFRIFERLFGSRKYASVVVWLHILSLLVDLLLLFVFGSIGSGPYGVIFGLLAFYYADIPVTSHIRIGPPSAFAVPAPSSSSGEATAAAGGSPGASPSHWMIAVSEKALLYLLAAQMIVFGPAGSFWSAVSGVLSAVIYRSSAFLQSVLILPAALFTAPPPSAMRFSFIPPHMSSASSLAAAASTTSTTITTTTTTTTTMSSSFLPSTVAGSSAVSTLQQQQPFESGDRPLAPALVTDENVDLLVSMGFPRHAAAEALQRTGNNAEVAVAQLLHQSGTR